MQWLSSAENPQYKKWRKLTTAHGRKKNGGYLVESVKLLADALGSGRPVQALIFRQGREEELFDQLKKYLQRFSTSALGRFSLSDLPVYVLPVRLFNALSTMEHSDGALAFVQGKLGQNFQTFSDHLLRNSPSASEDQQILLLDRIQDPGNLGTILRSAEAFDMTRVLALESVEFENPKTLRASMGSAFRLDLYTGSLSDFLDFCDGRRLDGQEDLFLIGADMEGEDYRFFEWPKSCCLVIGNEGQGIHPEIRKRLRGRIKIPMSGQVESLNAGVSASILMADRQRKGAS